MKINKTREYDSNISISLGSILFLIIIAFLLGVLAYKNLSSPMILLKSNTLIINKSNEWYWLQSQQYAQQQLNQYYTLKQILINNECIDGGFIDNNINEDEFVIVCYEAKKIIKKDLMKTIK